MAKAKKSSNNAIKKLDKQIDELKKVTEDAKETIPVIDKKELEKAKEQAVEAKKTSTKKKTTTKKSSTTKKKTGSKTTTKKKTSSKSTTKKKTTTTKKDAVVAPERPKTKAREITAEEVKKVVEKNKNSKYNKKQLTESTIKMKKLERHMRSLYDKVNSVVEDIDYVKTLDASQDVVISDIEVKENNKLTKVDDINPDLLHRLTMILGIVFIVYAIIVIGIIIYICTY